MGAEKNNIHKLEEEIDEKLNSSSLRAALPPEVLKKNVLVLVNEHSYDEAIKELNNFISSNFEYPSFKLKSERYVKHCIDLINAIRAKKNFSGISSLTRSKVQELNEKSREHYKELQITLYRIENVRVKLEMQDMRSIMWVVKAVVHSTWIVTVIALVLEFSGGIYRDSQIVIDDMVDKIINFIFNFL